MSGRIWSKRSTDRPEEPATQESPETRHVSPGGAHFAGVVDVEGVVQYAKKLPNVVHAERNLYTCSQDTQRNITAKIRELGLNRVIVASCTPRTHEPLFQETVREAGINPYLFEMANIRDQDSWVHRDDKAAASKKAKDLVRMAVARATLLEPLQKETLAVKTRAMVLGGGDAPRALRGSFHGQPQQKGRAKVLRRVRPGLSPGRAGEVAPG